VRKRLLLINSIEESGSRGKEAFVKAYQEMTKEELEKTVADLKKEYSRYQAMELSLDMSRGKPCKEQLDLSMGLMDALNSSADMTCEDGTDCRNYGVLGGIAEAKVLMGDMMENNPDNIIIYGNSSLNVMYDCISRSMTHGVMGNTPWCKLDKVKWLCPVPGYDRHFSITEYFGIEMINVPMTKTGPDMDMVEKLVASDEAIKGIWCVPKYSNPQGYSYSDETVRRFARLKPAAKDFRIYWDNAYGIHHLYDKNQDYLIEILAECKRAGNPDLVYKFASTSKITFPGSGIAALATSSNNLDDIREQMRHQTIGYDKVNQLRHVRYFKDIHGMVEHMRKHADIIRPKFEMVEDTFEKNLGGLGIGSWTKPNGGYFISFETLPGCAKEVVNRCRKAGVKLTDAGATFPYHKDPNDSNIRIAPTYPPINDLKTAAELFTLCVKLVSAQKLLAEGGYGKAKEAKAEKA
jgi:aspartate/methionine/tyrosine aminotransferase